MQQLALTKLNEEDMEHSTHDFARKTLIGIKIFEIDFVIKV